MIDLILQMIIANKEAIGTFLVTSLLGLLKRFLDIKKIKRKLTEQGLDPESVKKVF